MNKIFGTVAIIFGLAATLCGAIWAIEDRYQPKKEAVSPQTVQQLQHVLEEQMQGIERKNMMQDYEFHGLRSKRSVLIWKIRQI